MLLIAIEITVILLILVTVLLIAIRESYKSSKKQSSFLLTNADISNNIRSLMLSVNRTEYILGERTEEQYMQLIEDIDNSLMEK